MMTVFHTAARHRIPVVPALLTATAILLSLAGCGGPKLVTPKPPPIPESGGPVPEDNEVVLSDGTQLIAKTDWGRIKIEAGPGLRRVYTWRGLRRGVILKPRQKRFAGSFGIHYKGEPPIWAPADGITKVDVEEGQRNFNTMDDAMVWIQIRRLRYEWNNSGLVVGWKPDGDTLKVEVWQFYIDGEQPTEMPDAREDAIATGPVEVVPQKMKPVLLFADGRRKTLPEPVATAASAISTPETDENATAETADDNNGAQSK